MVAATIASRSATNCSSSGDWVAACRPALHELDRYPAAYAVEPQAQELLPVGILGSIALGPAESRSVR
ncbi:hypothetical protein [Micromonospora sp. WMMD712]|uniref:hypothetical protein n=1 Tax=Micromonospora sp. WMMD712 TaxID=3016096 RepID=UPI002499D2C9|nr:hypothetical protein [Micromonospora sp. WMMD712]